MLSGLLERHQCAECRFCCVFDAQDCWEMPSLLEPTANRVLRLESDTMLRRCGEVYTFDPKNVTEELYPCPVLSENGCTLGDLKPFECSIWPFRVMNLNDTLVLAVCTDCKALQGVPTSVVDGFANAKVRRLAFDYAKQYPQVVKPYHDNYRVVHE